MQDRAAHGQGQGQGKGQGNSGQGRAAHGPKQTTATRTTYRGLLGQNYSRATEPSFVRLVGPVAASQQSMAGQN